MPRLTSDAAPDVAFAYASHLPSGENSDPIGEVDVTSPNGADVLLMSVRIQRAELVTPCFPIPYDKYRPSGDHDSGTCASPALAVVSRSTTPLPSARCL